MLSVSIDFFLDVHARLPSIVTRLYCHFLKKLLLVVNLSASVQVLIELEAMVHAAGVCVYYIFK